MVASTAAASSFTGSFIVGVLAGGATLAIGQIVFATVRPPFIRAVIGLLYAVPASVAGYHATLGLSHIGVPSEVWREAFAAVGAVLIGGTAWVRMSLFVPQMLNGALRKVRHRFHWWLRPKTGEPALHHRLIGYRSNGRWAA